MFASYASSLAIRDSVKCRRLIESPWYQSMWGNRFALTSDQNTKGRFDNSRTGYRLATSVGGAVTGEGGDRIVCDDPHNVQEAESDAVRKATLDWWDVVMSTRVNDPKTTAKVVVMREAPRSCTPILPQVPTDQELSSSCRIASRMNRLGHGTCSPPGRRL